MEAGKKIVHALSGKQILWIGIVLFITLNYPPKNLFIEGIPGTDNVLSFLPVLGFLVYWKTFRRIGDSRQQTSVMRTAPMTGDFIQRKPDSIAREAHYVIHDIKNALAGIQSCAEVLQYEDLEPDDRISFASTIVEEIERVTLLSQNVLQEYPGKQSLLKREPYSLKRLLEKLLSVIESNCKRRHITLISTLHDVGTCHIDTAQIQRVFMNILTNACDAMPHGGSLRISLEKTETYIHLEFVDTGCGMSPELQAEFLEPHVTSGKAHGTGLGMAIVKQILDQYEAVLEVESLVGQGTTIRILLPT